MTADQDAQRRFAILMALSLVDGYCLGLAQIREQLDALDYPVSTDRARTDCAWLAEQGLLALTGDSALTLTERGLDVATDRAQVHGVSNTVPASAATWPRLNI